MSARARYKIVHPTRPGVEIAYGIDDVLPGAFFCELHDSERVTHFDGLTPSSGFDPYGAPLEQVLHKIAEFGGYTLDELHELLLLREQGYDDLPQRLRLVCEVVENLLAAADGP